MGEAGGTWELSVLILQLSCESTFFKLKKKKTHNMHLYDYSRYTNWSQTPNCGLYKVIHIVNKLATRNFQTPQLHAHRISHKIQMNIPCRSSLHLSKLRVESPLSWGLSILLKTNHALYNPEKKKTLIQKTHVLAAQPKCPFTDEWIKKLWDIYKYIISHFTQP